MSEEAEILSFLRRYYPGLGAAARVTSPKTHDYNCVAFVMGDRSRWWWPDRERTFYWPPQMPRSESIDSFQHFFMSLGYSRCDSEELEAGIEKVAIFAVGESVKHVAMQLTDGDWSSKLGPYHDISHELSAFQNSRFGNLVAILSRPSS